MPRMMIALVSDQRMQNVIPILQAGARYDELTLVLSKDRRTGKPLDRYVHSAGDLKAVLEGNLKVNTCQEWVDPYNIEVVMAVVGSCIQDSGHDDQVVNISGGTKPMAIGALRAAQAAQVPSLYTNTEDNEILWLFPDGSTSSEPIQVVGLDVPLYIRAYGERVTESKTVADLDAACQTWAEIIGSNHKVIYQQVVVPIMSAIKEAHREKSGLPIVCSVRPTHRQLGIIEQLAQEGLWEWDQGSGQITVAEELAIECLNGFWVEHYVAMKMQYSGLFDDVRLNVKLDGVDGEIDVAAVSNGKLVLVECKSNVQRSEQLSKLDSFRRRLGGPFAQAYYGRASEAYAAQIQAQARKFGLNGVVFGAQIRDIGEVIGKNLGTLPKPYHLPDNAKPTSVGLA